MATKAKTKVRPRYVKVPHGATCAICGIDKPIDTAHIIPQRLLKMIPDMDRRFFDYNGINIIYLCKNHHALFDKGLLTEEESFKIFKPLHHALLEFHAHMLQAVLPKKTFTELQAYIATLTYHDGPE